MVQCASPSSSSSFSSSLILLLFIGNVNIFVSFYLLLHFSKNRGLIQINDHFTHYKWLLIQNRIFGHLTMIRRSNKKKKKQPKIVKEVTVHVCVHFLSFYSVTANQTGKQWITSVISGTQNRIGFTVNRPQISWTALEMCPSSVCHIALFVN